MIKIPALIFGLFITPSAISMLQETQGVQAESAYRIQIASEKKMSSAAREPKTNRSCMLFLNWVLDSSALPGKIPWRIQG